MLTTGIVVPDANVLLNLYRYNSEAQADLMSVLERLGERLWVPHQVVAEFWRNREAALQDLRDEGVLSEDACEVLEAVYEDPYSARATGFRVPSELVPKILDVQLDS